MPSIVNPERFQHQVSLGRRRFRGRRCFRSCHPHPSKPIDYSRERTARDRSVFRGSPIPQRATDFPSLPAQVEACHSPPGVFSAAGTPNVSGAGGWTDMQLPHPDFTGIVLLSHPGPLISRRIESPQVTERPQLPLASKPRPPYSQRLPFRSA
jgi:hypothetical protein